MMRMKLVMMGCLCGLWLAQSPFLMGQTRADCLACHSDSSLSKERDGKTVSLYVNESAFDRSPHKKLVCIACHTGFDPGNVPHKEKITAVDCARCHKEAVLKHSFHPQLARAVLNHEEPDVSCKDCHGTHDIESPKVAGTKFSETHLTEACGECHSDVSDHFKESAHGKAIAANVQGAPNCLTCHRQAIVNDTDTLAMKLAQVKLCLSCHLDKPEVRSRTSLTAGFLASYEKSVHGAALLNGNSKVANCVDCHGNHDMKKGNEPTALMNRNNIPATCGKCHADIAQSFNESVHGKALAGGMSEAPTCTNCHGEHTIYEHTDPRSSVASRKVSAQCTSCHSSVKLSEKYGLPGKRTETFADSYHGLAFEGGAVNVANCASCHGAHNIKPSSDSTSTVSKANLAKTCGKCHPGANKQFAVGSVHVALTAEKEPILYWIATAYIVLIITTIGGMFIHNLLDWLKKSRRKLRIRRGVIEEPEREFGLYLRMTLSERLQHAALLISFTLLVITGFMLRYPDAGWVTLIRSLSDRIFDLRSIVHRIAAVVMVSASLFHIGYLSGTKRGRQLFKDLLPKLQDARDAMGMLKFNFGISRQRPRFGRFSYIEKSEYWALLWGTMVMAVTGTIMWFDNTFIGLFSKLGYDISRTIHFYEAWLATLAIVVWHLYFVIFNPDVYPINLAFWKGTITEEEMEEDHPLELDEIRRARMEEGTDASEPQAVAAGNNGLEPEEEVQS